VERSIAPLSTDPTLTQALQPHVAINPAPSVGASGQLVVFLPGTQAQPEHYLLILRAAAAKGYHAIGLNHVNAAAVGQMCAHDPAPDCHGQVRDEVITGQDRSPLVSVGASDSIVNRLAKLLAFLHTTYPTEGWGQFLDAQRTPVWAKLNVAGHSQGGGHAGVMAKMFSLNRVAYFSSPADWRSALQQPAFWLSRASATPASRQYAFSHLQDSLVPWANLVSIWSALQLDAFGPAVSVDGRASYGGSHQLSTNATPGSGLPTAAHGAPVFDASVPKNPDGSPVYAPVWSYLLFP
jgi:hypothetical protein